MKIKKLVVKNYKVFDHLELDFTDKNGEVLDTIVLAGLNGSGKTTVLELLIDIIKGIVPNGSNINTKIYLEILLTNRYYRADDIERHKSVLRFPDSIFNNEEFISIKPYSNDYYVLKFDFDIQKDGMPDNGTHPYFTRLFGIINNLRMGNNKIFKTHTIYFYSKDKSKKSNSSQIIETTFITNNQKVRTSILDIITQRVFRHPDTAPRQIFTEQVNELNKIFKNLDVKSKLIQVNEKDLIFESVNSQKIGFDDLSSGEKMLYFIGFTLNQYNPYGMLIMVDEPEDSLHPKWQQQIVRFFNNVGSDNQVILATHSPQIIASVHPESLFVLAINDETHRVEAINMADEHKHSFGVDPNRILSEIMGTPIRDYEMQLKINALSDKIKKAEFDPSVSDLSEVEKEVDALAEDFGKQDATIMRFRNELRLLKRKTVTA